MVANKFLRCLDCRRYASTSIGHTNTSTSSTPTQNGKRGYGTTRSERARGRNNSFKTASAKDPQRILDAQTEDVGQEEEHAQTEDVEGETKVDEGQEDDHSKPKATKAKKKKTTAKPKATKAKKKTTAKPKKTTAKPKKTTAKPKKTTAKPKTSKKRAYHGRGS